MRRLRAEPVALCALAILAVILSAPDRSNAASPRPFQSELPTPKNQNYFSSSIGGRLSCGPQQSSVYLEISAGFVSGDGAEVHCTPTSGLTAVPVGQTVLNAQGYLVGIYAPALLKPLTVVFELDLAHIDSVCATCVVAKYYVPASRQWRALPTVFDPGAARVYVTIVDLLPQSGLSGYSDRTLIALFITTATPLPRPTHASVIPTLTARTATAAATATAVSTIIPSSIPSIGMMLLIVVLLIVIVGMVWLIRKPRR